jgi:hypothetical protein
LLSRLDPAAKKLLVRIPVAGAAALLLWFAGGYEIYERALMKATEGAIRLFERPPATLLTWEESTVLIRRADFSSRSQLPVFDPSAVAGNAVLLLALYLSTPGASSRRSVLAGAFAFLALFASHVVHFALAIETIYATQLGAWSVYAYERWQREVVATGRYFFDIALKYALPFVFWGLFVLIPHLRRSESLEEMLDAPAEPAWKRHRRKKR